MKRYRFYIPLLLLALLVIPSHLTHASIFDSTAQGFVSGIISWMFVIMQAILGAVIAGLVWLLNTVIYMRAFADADHVPIVVAIWKILRDLSNMLFILILIYMAFATIFNTKNYKFQDMIVRLIIAAVLINFSLVIGRFVIDFFQVLNNVFLRSIGNPGDKLGQFLNPAQLVQGKPGVNGFDLTGAAGVGLIFSVILSAMYAFSLLVGVLFALFRVFAIWGLLAVAPIAWMAYILPGTKQWFGKWWSYFFGWNLFLPVYLFVLYIGLVFLSQGRTVIQAVTGSADTPLFGTGNITVNLLFFYVFAAFFLSYGTWMATKMTSAFGGQGFKAGVDWAKTAVKRTPIPGVGSLQGYQDAINRRWSQFKKEGFEGERLNKLYGGEKGYQRQVAQIADRWPLRTQKTFTENSKLEYEKISDDYDTGKVSISQLKELAVSKPAASAAGYAYRKLLIEKGGMDGFEFKRAILQLKGNPYAVNELIKTAKDKKFAGITNLRDVALSPELSDPNLTPARREMLLYTATDEKMAGGYKIEDIETAGEILGGDKSPETKKFLDDLAKIRPDLAYTYRTKHRLLGPEPERDANGLVKMDETGQPVYKMGQKTVAPTRFDMFRKSLNTEVKNVASFGEDTWKAAEFKMALKDKFYDESRTSYKSLRSLRENLERVLMEKGQDEKLKILEEVVPKEDFLPQNQAPLRQGGRPEHLREQEARRRPGDRQNRNRRDQENEEEDETAPEAPEENPPQAGGASYKNILGVNRANVVDLRNKKDYEIK